MSKGISNENLNQQRQSIVSNSPTLNLPSELYAIDSYAAIEAGLEVIPVLNKIDSIDADKDSAKKQIFNLIGSSR